MKLIRYQYPQSRSANAFNRLFDLGAPTIERFGSMFDDFFSDTGNERQLAVDLYEDADNYYACSELPGIRKETIDVELENSVLSIRNQQNEDPEAEPVSYSFNRSVRVPDGIATDRVEARYEAGILTITLPKEEARKPLQIDVK